MLYTLGLRAYFKVLQMALLMVDNSVYGQPLRVDSVTIEAVF